MGSRAYPRRSGRTPVLDSHVRGRAAPRTPSAAKDAAQRRNQLRSAGLQLSAMVNRKLAQHALTARGQRNEHLTAVLARALALHQPLFHQPVDELNRAVMLDLQPLGQLADRGAGPVREPLQSQHQLVVLRFDTGLAGRLLTEAQELAYAVAKRGQGAIIVRFELGRIRHREGSVLDRHAILFGFRGLVGLWERRLLR